MPSRRVKRGHSVGDLRVESADLLFNSAGKKPKHHHSKNEQQSQSQSSQSESQSTVSLHLDEVLNAVASRQSCSADNNDTASAAPTQSSDSNWSVPLGVAPSDINIDMEMMENIVSKCVAAQIVPMSAEMNALKNEIHQLKNTVANLSSQVAEMLTTLLATITSKHDENNTAYNSSPPQQSSDTAQQLVASSYASATASNRFNHNILVPTSQPNHQNPGHDNHVRNAKQDAVTAMYVNLNKKQQRANNIIIRIGTF